ncbi:MAG: hypothetical protein QXL17_02810 [Candidatus Thermoplasmatota archaeon]
MPAHKKGFLSFEEAKELVQEEMISSVSLYKKWWDTSRPNIPKWPYRVYKKEWKGWNDFLGNKNTFLHNPKKRQCRPYHEAMLWAHSLKLKNSIEWKNYFKNNKDKIPLDIPSRPDLISAYKKQWVDWRHWLGSKPIERTKAQQEAYRASAILFLIHEKNYPLNVVKIGVEPNGKSALKTRWERERFDVIKIFKFKPEAKELIMRIINYRSTPVSGNQSIRIVPNIPQLLWELGNILDIA